MKKLVILVLLVSVLTGCSQKEDSFQKDYRMLFKTLEKTNKYTRKALPATLEVKRKEGTDTAFHYEIIVTKPEFVLDGLQVMALPINYDVEERAPNFNVLEKVDLQSFDDKKVGIKLNLFSDREYQDFKVLLKYQNKGNEFQDIVLLPVKVVK